MPPSLMISSLKYRIYNTIKGIMIGVIFLLALNIQAAEYKGKKPFNIDDTFKEIANKKGAVISEEPSLWRIDVETEAAVYFFTKKITSPTLQLSSEKLLNNEKQLI